MFGKQVFLPSKIDERDQMFIIPQLLLLPLPLLLLFIFLHFLFSISFFLILYFFHFLSRTFFYPIFSLILIFSWSALSLVLSMLSFVLSFSRYSAADPSLP